VVSATPILVVTTCECGMPSYCRVAKTVRSPSAKARPAPRHVTGRRATNSSPPRRPMVQPDSSLARRRTSASP
jgi:hypothetical protein